MSFISCQNVVFHAEKTKSFYASEMYFVQRKLNFKPVN